MRIGLHSGTSRECGDPEADREGTNVHTEPRLASVTAVFAMRALLAVLSLRSVLVLVPYAVSSDPLREPESYKVRLTDNETVVVSMGAMFVAECSLCD